MLKRRVQVQRGLRCQVFRRGQLPINENSSAEMLLAGNLSYINKKKKLRRSFQKFCTLSLRGQ